MKGFFRITLSFFLASMILGCENSTRMPGVGETTVLTGGATGIPAATSEGALSRLNQAFKAKDEFAFNQLEKSGEVIVLPNLTGAKVIEMEVGSVQVRISAGEFANRAFFVDPQYVK